MDMQLEIWTDGSTGGFNIKVDGQLSYHRSYEVAHAALVSLGMAPEQATTALENARRKAKP